MVCNAAFAAMLSLCCSLPLASMVTCVRCIKFYSLKAQRERREETRTMTESYEECEEFLLQGANMDVDGFLAWWKEPHTARTLEHILTIKKETCGYTQVAAPVACTHAAYTGSLTTS